MAIAYQAIHFLKLAQKTLKNWRGKTAVRCVESIMEATAILLETKNIPELEIKEKHIQQYFNWYHLQQSKDLGDREFI